MAALDKAGRLDLQALHRAIDIAYGAAGRAFFADEDNLNLMRFGDLRSAAKDAGIPAPNLTSVRLLGWPSNLLLVARK